MPFGRLKIVSLFAVIALAGSPVEACWLTDWLYGRSNASYAVGYAPYSANYTPYVAGYAPAAGFANTTAIPLNTPVANSGVFQAQRPSYFENPSVYTGFPTSAGAPVSVGTNLQTAFSVPLSTPQLFRSHPSLLGAGSTSSYFGASKTYPNNIGTYAANFPAVPTGTPATALPTTQVAPLFPNAPTPVYRGGLARFFGRLFGTNYRTSYYRAPVTYYRPVTSIDPLSGTTVTVQQPCTSTIEQLQRTPFNSFRAVQPIGVAQVGSCNAPGLGFAPSGVSPATALTAPGQFTVPIPSTNLPPNGFGQFPQGAAPLTGSPAAPQTQSDLSPVEQPSLSRVPVESDFGGADRYGRPEVTPPAPSSPAKSESSFRQETPAPKRESRSLPSYWDMQDAEDSTAMLPSKQDRRPPAFANNHPIRALPSDHGEEPSPFPSELIRRDTDRRADSAGKPHSFVAPPLPRRSAWDDESSVRAPSRSRVQQAAAWIPVREASNRQTAKPHFVPRAFVPRTPEAPRDSVWNTGR